MVKVCFRDVTSNIYENLAVVGLDRATDVRAVTDMCLLWKVPRPTLEADVVVGGLGGTL